MRVARVGHSPDKKIPRAQDTGIRKKDPGVIIGLTSGMPEMGPDSPYGDIQTVSIGDVGIIEIFGKRRSTVATAKLSNVDDPVPVDRFSIASEAFWHRFVTDSLWGWPSFGFALFNVIRDPEDVIGVTVRKDGGVQPLLGHGTNGFIFDLRVPTGSRIDEDQTVFRLRDNRVGKTSVKPDALGDLLDRPGLPPGVMGVSICFSSPKCFGKFQNFPHISPHPVLQLKSVVQFFKRVQSVL